MIFTSLAEKENYILNGHDSHKLLTPMRMTFDLTPILKAKVENVKPYKTYAGSTVMKRNVEVKAAHNLCHMTFGKVTMKVLKFFEDGNEHNYREIRSIMFPDKILGHDVDCYNSLRDRDMIEFSSKGKHGVMFFRITPFGQEILNICKINDVYYKTMRWFCLDEDEMFSALMKADMGDEDTRDDISTESILNLVKSLLSTESSIAKLGSRYRFMNKFMQKILTSQNFYEAVNQPEINSWLDEHKDEPEVTKFYVKWGKVQKKWNKKLAA